MSVHGGRLAAKALKQAGVECIFTLSGGHVMAIYDGCIDEGIEVIDTVPDSPAHQAGVQSGDIIVALNGRITTHIDDLHKLLNRLPKDTELQLSLVRRDRLLEVAVRN